MDIKIIIATHGIFADGIYDSLSMIIGEKENIERLNAYVDENKDYPKIIEDYVASHNYNESDLLVITDLYGGSVNNEFMKYLEDYPFYLVSGLNLGLLLEFALLQKPLSLELVKETIAKSKGNIVLCNEILSNVTNNESDF